MSPAGPPPGGPRIRAMMTRLEDGRELCRYFKFGFCKFQNTPDGCSKRHNDQVCPQRESCQDIDRCDMRHPRSCRFLRDNGWCSVEDCVYVHEPTQENILQGCLQIVKDFMKDLSTQFHKDTKDGLHKEISESNQQFQSDLTSGIARELKVFVRKSTSSLDHFMSSFMNKYPRYINRHSSDLTETEGDLLTEAAAPETSVEEGSAKKSVVSDNTKNKRGKQSIQRQIQKRKQGPRN